MKNFEAKKLICLRLGSIPGVKYRILALHSFFKVSIFITSYVEKEMM